MKSDGLICRSASIGLFVLCAAILAWGQTDNPGERPQKVVTEINDAHKRWFAQDAKYIITDAERKAFLALKTNEERENFIEDFWRRRDPNPETEENEFREEYYQRFAYANENFASGIPGWMTDRGRIYITWGKPDSIESHPSGGSYDRPSYEGGGSTTTYPFETWFYRHLDGVGDGIEIEFVDRTGSGEYRIARDADEKDVLATTPLAGNRIDPTNGIGGFQREQDTPTSRALRNAALDNPPRPKFTELYGTLTSGAVIDNNPLAIDVRVDYFRQSGDRVITAFTVQANNKDLKFEPRGELSTATINILGRITSVANKRSGIFEDAVTTNSTTSELTGARNRRSVYQRSIALAPGVYKVEVIVRDVGTGNTGVVRLGFEVPKYDESKLSTSSLILASTLRRTNDGDIGGQFVIGNAKVIPNLETVFKQGQNVGIYLQVYNAGVDETTLKPAVDVNYVIVKDGKEILRKAEDWSGLSDSGKRLTLARVLPTTDLPAGEYEVRVEIRDRTGEKELEPRAKFTIVR